MKIAIISDIHNNETNLKKVLDFCGREKIETIICCGDLASQETLDFMNDNFWKGSSTSKEVELPHPVIHYVFGNMDNDQLQDFKFVEKYKNTFIYKNFGEIEIENNQIGFIHFPREAKEMAESGKYDFVFYGHTHKPWTEKIGNCTLLNPGNVTGDFYPPTFAVWDTTNNNFELKRIHDLA